MSPWERAMLDLGVAGQIFSLTDSIGQDTRANALKAMVKSLSAEQLSHSVRCVHTGSDENMIYGSLVASWSAFMGGACAMTREDTSDGYFWGCIRALPSFCSLYLLPYCALGCKINASLTSD
jgi:hypothetical protein